MRKLVSAVKLANSIAELIGRTPIVKLNMQQLKMKVSLRKT